MYQDESNPVKLLIVFVLRRLKLSVDGVYDREKNVLMTRRPEIMH